ncbi:MAG: nucleoside-diphosphate kinase [Candidatus Moranbacteria bacterium]|nr:nucleoside-diphosphate kinase [Candidatus Moranbacteria bacterium]
MEQTLFIIKPEAFNRRKEITGVIIDNGFIISDTLERRLTYNDLLLFRRLDQLYLRDEELFSAYVYFMSMGTSELGIIEGFDAVARFKRFCGLSPQPSRCAIGTLRRMFGLGSSGFYRGREFFLNAVHKSDNKGDARVEVEIFKNFCKY